MNRIKQYLDELKQHETKQLSDEEHRVAMRALDNILRATEWLRIGDLREAADELSSAFQKVTRHLRRVDG